MLRYDPNRPLVRLVVGVAGLAVTGLGVAGVRLHSDLHYTNWFGEPVFAPFATVFGLIMLGGAIFKSQILRKPLPRSRKRY